MESTSQGNSLNTLLGAIDLFTTGIIWTPTNPIKHGDNLLFDLDYFFDGTISRGVHHHHREQDFSLFTTNNFGKDLKLGLLTNNNSFDENLKIFIDLVNYPTDNFKILLIQDIKNKDLEKKVEKRISSIKNCTLEKLYF